MSDNSLLSLIANLNSESPVQSSSPEDYAAELSLWTNAEFTFDMPPGLGIFEGDSGFDSFTNTTTDTTPSTSTSVSESTDTTTTTLTDAITPNLDFLNLPQTLPEPRPLSLLERTRQRNPVSQVEQPRELQEQVAAVNSFHSLLAAYSASSQFQQIQQEQQNILSSLVNPLSAPTTPAAAKLLRQPMPEYKEPASKRQKTTTSPSTPSIPPSPLTVLESTPSSQDNGEYELSAADSFSRDDPEYLTKVAVEEDKRRRNTAASARFRQKKKLREQALEQTAREQTLRAEGLEARVKELEMEVRWLRGLIVEKDSRLHEAALTLQNQGIRL